MPDMLRAYMLRPALFLTLSACCVSASAQEVRERELKPSFDFTTIEMPVEIVSIKLNGQEVRAGTKISADKDWLRGVSFTLKNVSDKPIVYVAVTLQFSDPEDSEHPQRVVAYFLTYGRDITSERPLPPQSAPKALQPGEVVKLILSDEKYPAFLQILARGEMTTDVATAKYYVHSVVFENEPDALWRYGKWMRRDPNDPNKFNVGERYALPSRHD